jgi:hypothetical protein
MPEPVAAAKPFFHGDRVRVDASPLQANQLANPEASPNRYIDHRGVSKRVPNRASNRRRDLRLPERLFCACSEAVGASVSACTRSNLVQ